MALIGNSAQESNLLQREPILAQVLARALHLAAQDIGMRPHAVMHMEFARELHGRAVADIGQFLERDVPGDVLLDIVLDQPCVCWPEASLRTGHLELHAGISSKDVHARLKRQSIVAEPAARASFGYLLH